MSNKITNHTGIPFLQLTINQALVNIKAAYEASINANQRVGTIRSSSLIKHIHNVIKTDLINNGVHPSLVNPSKDYLEKVISPTRRAYNRARKLYDKELKIAGKLKTKKQDISVVPDNIHVNPMTLTLSTMLNGYHDIFGDTLTEAILSINVRSQLSSIEKNFDTLYERTFAESLNLHLRCPNMVLGEVYLLPVKEYSDSSPVTFSTTNIEKYIEAFQAINARAGATDDDYKYERCCLLLIDFDRRVPKIYNTVQELINDGFLNATTQCTMANLDYQNFITDILRIYSTRFPTSILT
jgi:hypothetical protein